MYVYIYIYTRVYIYIYIYIYTEKKWNQKNMKECDKGISPYKQQTSCDLIYSNNGRNPVTNNFTPLHYTSPNYISPHFTTPVDTSLPLI
jgi:hypothetical protein